MAKKKKQSQKKEEIKIYESWNHPDLKGYGKEVLKRKTHYLPQKVTIPRKKLEIIADWGEEEIKKILKQCSKKTPYPVTHRTFFKTGTPTVHFDLKCIDQFPYYKIVFGISGNIDIAD